MTCVGLARTIYVRCIHGNFGRESTNHMAIYGVKIRFWPTLDMFAALPAQISVHQNGKLAGKLQTTVMLMKQPGNVQFKNLALTYATFAGRITRFAASPDLQLVVYSFNC